ncbi:hypothetical protein KY363_05140, partial [Candidatus Woesearchaeota archaeon]|nr:hypothetical protein [Candidatus Woesearchaeota archaeon]
MNKCKSVVFLILVCLMASAVSALLTAPVKVIAPVKIVTNTTSTVSPNLTVKSVTAVNTTVNTYEYDGSSIVADVPEKVISSESPDLVRSKVMTYSYNDYGEIVEERPVNSETGTRTGASTLKGALAVMSDFEYRGETFGGAPHAIELVCPVNQTYTIDWPADPYNFSGGDCASIGNEAAIEEYIQALYAIAKDCYDYTDTAVQEMYDQRDAIVDYLDSCYAPNPDDRDPSMHYGADPMPPMIEGCSSLMDPSGGIDETPDGFAYTHLLQLMKEDVNDTCRYSHVFNKNLVCMCNDVAAYINGNDFLYWSHKQQFMRQFGMYNLSAHSIYNPPNVSMNGFRYLNNSWHHVYNPQYIDCSPDIEIARYRLSPALYAAKAFLVGKGSQVLSASGAGAKADEKGISFAIDGDVDLTNSSDEIVALSPKKLLLASKAIKDVMDDTSQVELDPGNRTRFRVRGAVVYQVPGEAVGIDDGVNATTKESVQLKNGSIYLGNGNVLVKVLPSQAASAAFDGVDGESRDWLSVNDHDFDIELAMSGGLPEYLVEIG